VKTTAKQKWKCL